MADTCGSKAKPPVTATIASIFPTGRLVRSSRRCAGATRGGNSSSWLISPPTLDGARRRRRSRRSRWRPSDVSTRSSTASARSTARPPPNAWRPAKRGASRWSRRSRTGCLERARLSRRDAVATAIDHMLTRWPSFIRFLEDGRICLSNNNTAERALLARLGARTEVVVVRRIGARRRTGGGHVHPHRDRKAQRN